MSQPLMAVSASYVIRVTTRCTTIEEFVAVFAPVVDEASIRMRSDKIQPDGARRRFRFELADGTPALRGVAEVCAISPERPADLRLVFLKLDEASREIHWRMLGRARATGTGRHPPLMAAAHDDEAEVALDEGSQPAIPIEGVAFSTPRAKKTV